MEEIKIVNSNWLNSLKGIIRAGIYLSLLTPLLISNKFFFPFVGPKSIYFMAIAEIVFFCWVILAIFAKEYRPKMNLLTVSLIIFLIIITLSGIFGVNPSNSFWSKHERITGLLMMYHLFGFFLVLSSTIKTKKDWLQIFSASTGIAVLIGILSFRPEILHISQTSARGGATLGNSSFLGTYLLFNFFLALFNLVNAKKFWKLLWGACMIFFFLSMFLNGARAATLMSIGGLVLIGLLWLSFIPKKKIFKWIGRGLIAVSICIFIITAYLVFQKDSFIQKLMIKNVMGSRLITLNASWDAFRAKPILGWGWENFDSIWTKYYNPSSPTTTFGSEYWYDKAHNVVAETAATSGILGLFSYLSIFVIAAATLTRKYLKKNDFWLSAIFISLLVAYFVQNLTVFDMVSSYIMLFLVLGFIAIEEKGDDDVVLQPAITSSKIGLSLIVVVCAIISLIFFVINPLKSSGFIGKLGTAKTTTERLGYYKGIISTSPLGKFQNRDYLARETIALSKSEIIKNISAETFAQEVNFITQELEKTVKESKYDIRSMMDLSQLYSLRYFFFGETFEKAQNMVEQTLNIGSNNQQVLWNAAQIALFQKKYDDALQYTQKAVDIEPNLAESYYMYFRISLLTGKKDLAEKMLEKGKGIIQDVNFEQKAQAIFDQYIKK